MYINQGSSSSEDTHHQGCRCRDVHHQIRDVGMKCFSLTSRKLLPHLLTAALSSSCDTKPFIQLYAKIRPLCRANDESQVGLRFEGAKEEHKSSKMNSPIRQECGSTPCSSLLAPAGEPAISSGSFVSLFQFGKSP